MKRIKQRQGWVDRSTIARWMGVKLRVVARWVRAELLVPVTVHGSAHYFDVTAVEDFIQGHVFTETAAAMLDVGRLTVQRWARRGKLKPVSGPGVDGCLRYLFRREEIEAWSDDEIVTAPELARRLGDEPFTGFGVDTRWEVEGPGIDQCKHYLFRHSMG